MRVYFIFIKCRFRARQSNMDWRALVRYGTGAQLEAELALLLFPPVRSCSPARRRIYALAAHWFGLVGRVGARPDDAAFSADAVLVRIIVHVVLGFPVVRTVVTSLRSAHAASPLWRCVLAGAPDRLGVVLVVHGCPDGETSGTRTAIVRIAVCVGLLAPLVLTL